MRIVRNASHGQGLCAASQVDKARVREHLAKFYGPRRPERDQEPPALAEASFAWGLLGQHMSALWRGPPAWEVMRGTFDAVLGHDAVTAAARAKAAAARALKPTKARLMDDGRTAATADTVANTMTSRQAAANAQRQSDLLTELKALMQQAPVVSLAAAAPRPALPLLHTLLDPWSFTQSVENVFFFSSLVKARSAGVDVDSAGNPVIVLGTEELTQTPDDAAAAAAAHTPSNTLGKGGKGGNSTYQFVWNLDRPLWRAALDVFGIRRPLLTHRDSSDSSAPPDAVVKTFYGGMAHRRGGQGGGGSDDESAVDNEMMLPVATGSSQQAPALVFDASSGDSDSGDGGFVSAASSEGTPPPRRGTKRARSPHSSGRVVSAARGRGRRPGSARGQGRRLQAASDSE